ncbi:hypothetical protein, partial [Streptomyces sp. NPDC002692]
QKPHPDVHAIGIRGVVVDVEDIQDEGCAAAGARAVPVDDRFSAAIPTSCANCAANVAACSKR